MLFQKLRTFLAVVGLKSLERPDITFNAVELDGFSTLLIGAADNIDTVRDNLPSLTR